MKENAEEVTAEQREAAHAVLDSLDYMVCCVDGKRAAPWADGHWKACTAIAQAIAAAERRGAEREREEWQAKLRELFPEDVRAAIRARSKP